MPASDPHDVPDRAAALAAELLNAEYAELARGMAQELARCRPSPFDRGEPRSWAAAVVHAAGWVNFLGDPAQSPHMSLADLAARSGVGQSTIAARFRVIRDTLDLVRMDPEWTLPSRLADNPLVWMALVDGIAIDLRHAPRALQEAALEQGLIPFLPPTSDDAPFDGGVGGAGDAGGDPGIDDLVDPGAPGLSADVLAELQAVIDRTYAGDPGASMDDVNAALAGAVDALNRRPQPALGGLAPADVQRLLDADWEGADSAIQLDATLTLAELEPSRTLHDARVLLALLAEGGVRATPKGNLPRATVAAFRERMRPPAFAPPDREGARRVTNEEDVAPLHVVRLLLDVAGLVKRRRGVFTLTRRGERLAAAERAGELFATLLRAHFRRFDLAYLDGAEPAPGFQHTVGFTLWRFGRVGDDWRKPYELADQLVLPVVRDELPVDLGFDVLPLILETRFLRPLAAFGLAESRPAPREAEEPFASDRYRKAPLFDRVLSFRLLGAG